MCHWCLFLVRERELVQAAFVFGVAIAAWLLMMVSDGQEFEANLLSLMPQGIIDHLSVRKEPRIISCPHRAPSSIRRNY
jgi:hypothetical protein